MSERGVRGNLPSLSLQLLSMSLYLCFQHFSLSSFTVSFSVTLPFPSKSFFLFRICPILIPFTPSLFYSLFELPVRVSPPFPSKIYFRHIFLVSTSHYLSHPPPSLSLPLSLDFPLLSFSLPSLHLCLSLSVFFSSLQICVDFCFKPVLVPSFISVYTSGVSLSLTIIYVHI